MPAIQVNEVNPAKTMNTSEDEPFEAKTEKTIDDDSKPDDQEPAEKEQENEIDVLGNGQIKMKVIQRGEPNTRPQPSDICNVKLICKLEDGKIVEEFNSLRIQVGEHEVIQALDLIIPLMDVGDEVIAHVAPRFAYGAQGLEPDIPPNATLIYHVELLKVDEEPPVETLSFDKRLSLVSSKRSRGNWWYMRHDPTKAIQCYRKAIDLLAEDVPYTTEEGKNIEPTDDVLKSFSQERLVIYNNLAASQMQVNAFDSALISVDNVLRYEPKNVKALFRKGKILVAKGDINDAIELLKEAFQLEPENNAIIKELKVSLARQQSEKQHEKDLYKKMLGQNSKATNDDVPKVGF